MNVLLRSPEGILHGKTTDHLEDQGYMQQLPGRQDNRLWRDEEWSSVRVQDWWPTHFQELGVIAWHKEP